MPQLRPPHLVLCCCHVLRVVCVPDLLPVPLAKRTFQARDFAALWVTLVISITTYYLAASLVDMGMAWWQVCAFV
jgi:cytosine/uracil/thiamine/allantoin permease